MSPIDCIDAQLLKLACAENSVALLAGWADPIKLGCQKFDISTPRDIACLLAQAGHESAGLTRLSENLNYSTPQRLLAVWPSHFDDVDDAQQYCHNPQALANHVYADRMGNGDEDSGDGWRYRGFGPFQLTGKANQQAFGNAVGMAVEDVPNYLRTTDGGAMSMCWFFQTHGLHALAETPGCADETRVVNGGEDGLADRTARFNLVLDEINRRLGL